MPVKSSSLGPGRFTALTALCAALLLCGTASATITLSTTTRAGTSATGTGTAISGRAPLPVVIDAGSGTTTTHTTGSAQQIGIRWAEQKFTNLSYDHDTGGGAGVDPQITCTNCFTGFSWELANVENDDNDTTEWVASTADANEFYHDGGTEIHGEPIGLRINGSDAVEGTCCALGAGEWGWCNPNTCDAADPNANRVMVRLSDNSDPDAQAAGYVQAIYGDGEYIELQHATWNSGNAFFAYVKNKVSDDAITLAAAPSGADSDETNVTGYQAVNPWTDLRFNYSVTCTGAVCIEDISNGDQRPGLASTAIDETVGRGPIWAFVFKEGFDSDVAGAGGATITITANDDANGDTEDSQTIAVDEASWSGAAVKYLSSSGNDTNSGDSAGAAWLTADKGVEWLFQTATPPAELIIIAGETVDNAGLTTVQNVSAKTGDRRIRSSVAGTKAYVTVGANEYFLRLEGDGNADVRVMDIDINKAGGDSIGAAFFDCSDCVLLRVDIDSVARTALTIGTGADDSFDNIVWDCVLKTSNNAAGVYPIFYGGADAGELERRAIVGTRIDLAGGEHMMRAYCANFLAAYNYASSDAATGTPGVGFWLRSSTTTNVPGSYQYIYANYIRWNDAGTGSDFDGIAVSPEGSADAVRMDSVLIDSNFLLSVDASTIDKGIHVQTGPGKYFLAKNNIIAGFEVPFAKGGTTGALPDGRIFNNSAWATGGAAVNAYFWRGGSSTAGQSCLNIKLVNNAAIIATTQGGAGNSVIIQNNHATLSTVAATHILENVFDWGSVDSAWKVGASSGGFTGAGWPAQTGKAAQLNYSASQGKDNNPLFALPTSNDFRLCTAAGVPDASCSGASPCIDAGYDLPTVYYDYTGAVRNSDDVGAWDDDSVGMDMGAGPPVGSATLLGVGR